MYVPQGVVLHFTEDSLVPTTHQSRREWWPEHTELGNVGLPTKTKLCGASSLGELHSQPPCQRIWAEKGLAKAQPWRNMLLLTMERSLKGGKGKAQAPNKYFQRYFHDAICYQVMVREMNISFKQVKSDLFQEVFPNSSGRDASSKFL